MSDFNLGTVTAYGYAKDKGYTGTEDEFAELMASYADVAEQAADSADAAAASATTATAKASEAAASATAAASSKTAAETAQGGAETAAQTATTKAGEASASATTASGKATEATTAAGTATTKASEATTAATTATTKAGEASTSATNAAASATRAQEILDSIPEDYSQLSDDVSDLKDGFIDVIDAHFRYSDKGVSSFVDQRGISDIGSVVYDASKTGYMYKVTEGDLIYLNLNANTGYLSVWEFTTASTFGALSASNLVGSIHAGAVNGVVRVPNGATYLAVAQATGSSFTVADVVAKDYQTEINNIYGSDLYDVSTMSHFSSTSARGISNAGGIIYDADKTLKGFHVKAGDLIQLNLSANSGASTAVYVFKDTDSIDGTNVGDVCFNAVNDRITVPVGAVSLFIAQATATAYNVKSINTIVPELSEKITGASIGRLIEKSAWGQGWYTSEGSYITSDTHRFCTSDFIANEGHTVEVLDASLTVYAVFFDSSKTYLGASSAISGIMYIPESYAYFKVQLYKSTATINDADNVVIYNNAIPNVVKNNAENDVVVANFSQSRSSLFGDTYKPLEFIHFSDVHRQAVEWSNVCKYMDAHSKYIPFAIHTGDYVLSYNAQYADLYEVAVPNNGYILNVVGNHDIYSNSSGTERATQATTHSLLFNHTDDWGVTFGTEGAMYYHKDFAESGIRLVVIDLYYWDTAEATWLSNVLADAITNDLAVVTAMHIATNALPVNMRVDCTFNVVDELGTASTGEADTVTAIDDAIATFIDNGGEHIVNLCGHYHHDVTGYSAGGILNIAVECATHLPANWDDAVRDPATTGFDAFNVIAIDRTTKTIRIARIGNNSDWYGRAKNVLCYNYKTKQVVANY